MKVIAGDHLHLSQCTLEGNAVFEASDGIEIVTTSPALATRTWLKRTPEFSLTFRREFECSREHSNNGVRNIAKAYGLANHIASSAKPLLPGGVAENDDGWGTGGILTGMECSTEQRLNAEGVKKSCSHTGAEHHFGARFGPQ